jgi:hypothetical protein
MRRGLEVGARGEEDVAARANPGNIESRNGNARAMPAPCRKRRREIGRRVEMKGPDEGVGVIFIVGAD